MHAPIKTHGRESTAPVASSGVIAASVGGPIQLFLKSTVGMLAIPPPLPFFFKCFCFLHFPDPGSSLGNKFRRSDQQFIELFVRKYPKILVNGVRLPQVPCATSPSLHVKSLLDFPTQNKLEADVQHGENDS